MHLFFEPRSVVLIGVSHRSGPGAYNNLQMMLKYGYEGRVYVVHPTAPEILGYKTYSQVGDLPEVPDLAVISLGRDRVLPVFADCAEKGIRRVVIISQGFADADERGKELQAELVQKARQLGVRVVGPNTLGVVNPLKKFTTAFDDLERYPSPPLFSIVVQSGMFPVGSKSLTGSFGKAIDLGNGCDVDFVDALEYLETDPDTRVICLHMEGVTRGREFLKVASRVTRSKPIIVLKAGRSAAGAKAALSHTGSMVGEDAVFSTAFAEAGIIRVRNTVELLAVCKAFRQFGSIRGPRVGIVTASGAGGIIAADAFEDYGMELAPFPERLRNELEDPRISWHKLHNPIDLWPLGMVSGSFTGVFKRAVVGLLNDDNVDAVFGITMVVGSPLHSDLDMVAPLREVNKFNPNGKPIAMWLYGGDEVRQEEALGNEPNVACFGSIDEAVMGLGALWRYERFRRGNRPADKILGCATAGSTARPHPALPPGVLVGQPLLELLRAYDIPLVESKLTRDAESAASFAAEAGYPVVLKIISPEWLHKSDRGGVKLNIVTEAELRQAYLELSELFLRQTPKAVLEGILIQKQIKGVELIMGIKRDVQFGPALIVGMGGIYTEIFKDVARALVPVESYEAEAMLQSLRIAPILNGIRGQSGVDLPALTKAITSLSRLAQDYPGISELDLNPVLANSEGCWCVDSRIVVG